MAKQVATDTLMKELQSVLDKMGLDFERIEILIGALAAFSRPVPDYEPRFHHLHRATLNEHDLAGEPARET